MESNFYEGKKKFARALNNYIHEYIYIIDLYIIKI